MLSKTGPLMNFKKLLSSIANSNLIRRATKWHDQPSSFNSSEYWESRYASGSTSGDGSYGDLARFKATIINNFIAENAISSVIEFGCGDGNQISLGNYPDYLGIDVSETVIEICRSRYISDTSKKFELLSPNAVRSAELALSLDVIYHLVESKIYNEYMSILFRSATRYVIIYSTNHDGSLANTPPHIHHRIFTDWIQQHALDWRQILMIPNCFPFKGDTKTGSMANFYIYEKST
jgi:hypothetical protein